MILSGRKFLKLLQIFDRLSKYQILIELLLTSILTLGCFRSPVPVCMRACSVESLTICNYTDSSPPIIVFSPVVSDSVIPWICSMRASLSFTISWVCSNAWHPKRDSKLIGLICKEKLGRFSENPDKFRDEFVRLRLAVSFMWQDIMVILAHLGWKSIYRERLGNMQMAYWPPSLHINYIQMGTIQSDYCSPTGPLEDVLQAKIRLLHYLML